MDSTEIVYRDPPPVGPRVTATGRVMVDHNDLKGLLEDLLRAFRRIVREEVRQALKEAQGIE